MRIIFFGTPAFAVPSLEALAHAGHEIAAVVTQPDRPRGRGQKLQPSEVKVSAASLRASVLQPTRLKTAEFETDLKAFDADLGVVAAYGRILPPNVLAIPRLGMINVHASLLPRWRGAAPVHRAILAGDRETGVTIMRVVEALDAGPMLARMPLAIDSEVTSTVLEAQLGTMGASLLVETVAALARGPLTETPQDPALVTYAARLEKKESPINWARPAIEVHNHIRGLQPWPMADSRLSGRRIVLHKSQALPQGPTSPAGTVLATDRGSLVVATSPGAVRILEVQPEGRAPMPVAAYLNGHAVKPGDRFE